MAFVASNFQLVVSFVDNGGKTVDRTYNFVDGTVYADIITDIATTVATIAATSDCLISGYVVKSVFNNDTITLPAAGVQNENQAIITTPLLGKPRDSGTLTVPGAKIGMFVGSTGPAANVVNMAAGIVTSFIGLFVSGGIFTLSDGDNAILSGAFGKRRHTKNNNG